MNSPLVVTVVVILVTLPRGGLLIIYQVALPARLSWIKELTFDPHFNFPRRRQGSKKKKKKILFLINEKMALLL